MKKYRSIVIILLVGCIMTGCNAFDKDIANKATKDDEGNKVNSIETTSDGANNGDKPEKALANIKKIRKNKKSRKIGIIKPVAKIVVGKNFIIDQIEKNNNIDVNDPGAKSQWALTYTKSNLVWGEVDQKQDINVAVVDTGVDYTHPDLMNRVKKDLGYDFVNDDNDPMDDNGHGTHVSGIIAAQMNNEEGIVGIVGNLDVSIIPIKVLDKDGVGDSITIANAIEYAVEKEADIINLSLGGVEQDEDIKNAINRALEKGVFVVAASGNDKRNCDNYVPAGLEGVYTVAASNPLNKRARFSNFGESVDIAAPGVKILSTVPGNGYEAWDGTSMATPVVSGIAAMLMAQKPDIDIYELKDILSEASKDIMKEGEDISTGAGLVDAKKAFDIILKTYQ